MYKTGLLEKPLGCMPIHDKLVRPVLADWNRPDVIQSQAEYRAFSWWTELFITAYLLMNVDTVYGLLEAMGEPKSKKEHTDKSLVSMEEIWR